MAQQTPVSRVLYNMRPKGFPHAPAYSPQRDLAYIYAPALREAFAGLDKVHWQDYFKGWLEAEGITEDDLGEGVKRLCAAHELFTGDSTIKSPADALQQAGFFDVPNPVRVLIFERLGEVIMGGFFVAVRDVTCQGRLPPQIEDMADMIAAGRELCSRLHGQPSLAPDALQLELERTQALLESTQAVMQRQLRQIEEKTAEAYQADQLTKQYKKLLDAEQPLAAHMRILFNLSWYPRLYEMVKLYFKRRIS